MNEVTRNQLEVKLKKMLNHFDQVKAKKEQPVPQSGTGNIIRRRAGEKEKRFSTLHKSYCGSQRQDNKAKKTNSKRKNKGVKFS